MENIKNINITISEGTQIKEQQDLFGIFFEDLNHAADGGLYGEMVRNRAFEFDPIDNKTYCHMTAWEEVQRGNSFLQAHIEQWDPRNVRNPHYLVLEVLAPGEGQASATRATIREFLWNRERNTALHPGAGYGAGRRAPLR